MKLTEAVKAFIADEEGLTTVEYAVAGSLVAAATVTIFQTLGDNVCDGIETLSNAVIGIAQAGAGGC